MAPSAMEQRLQNAIKAAADPFDLDIRVIESCDAAVSLINLTDDNCGSSCPKACATAVG